MARPAAKTYVGRPCPHGHDGTRYAFGGHCVECTLAASKRRYAANPQRHLTLTKRWGLENKDRKRELARMAYARDPKKHIAKVKRQQAARADEVRKQRKEWYEKNRELSLARSAAWKKKNAARWAATEMRRVAAKIQRTPKWADEEKIAKFYEEAKRITRETGIRHDVDHIVPLRGKLVSGLHVHTNLQVIPHIANVRKRNRYEVAA